MSKQLIYKFTLVFAPNAPGSLILQISSIKNHLMACMSSEPVIEHNAAHTTLLHAAGKRTQEWNCSHNIKTTGTTT